MELMHPHRRADYQSWKVLWRECSGSSESAEPREGMALGSQEGLPKEVMITGILKSGKELADQQVALGMTGQRRPWAKSLGWVGGWQVELLKGCILGYGWCRRSHRDGQVQMSECFAFISQAVGSHVRVISDLYFEKTAVTVVWKIS